MHPPIEIKIYSFKAIWNQISKIGTSRKYIPYQIFDKPTFGLFWSFQQGSLDWTEKEEVSKFQSLYYLILKKHVGKTCKQYYGFHFAYLLWPHVALIWLLSAGLDVLKLKGMQPWTKESPFSLKSTFTSHKITKHFRVYSFWRFSQAYNCTF